MPMNINGKTFYTPNEAAKRLKISQTMLRYYRLEGRIEGTPLEDGRHLYSQEQLDTADVAPRPRGRKKSKESSDKAEDALAIAS